MNRMGDINWNLKPIEPVLYLARSDRKTITRLSEAKNIIFNEASEKVFELDFSLPYYIEKNGDMIKNPNIDKIGVMMLIKMELGERVEWFILSTPSTKTDAGGDDHSFKAYSTANQMSGVAIRGYSSEQPRILSDYLDILISSSSETYWTKGYVDGDLDAKFRSFEFDAGNLLQAIYELANKFEAIIEFDTQQSKVNMYAKENYGREDKLVLSHDNYLVQATKTEDALAMVTQLALYGSDGLTINRISPTGANYIEDFSYFLQGFEYDFQANRVISSSKFMSDELALALLKYSQLVHSKGELFREYLDEIEAIELELIPKIIELNDLKTELNVTKNSIDIWLTANNGEPNYELNEKRDELELAISNLESYIESRKERIAEIAGESYLTDRFIQYGAEGGLMGLLKEEMLITNNFSQELLDERANFIIKKDYSNDAIIDDRDLLEEGIKEFERLKEPKIDVSIDMLNILELIEAQRDWDRLKLGDKIRIVSPEIDLDVYAHINEVTYEFEEGNIKVNITNISRANSKKDAFLELMYKANTASNSIQVNKDAWSKGKDANDKVNAILNNVWDATKNKITSGVFSSIEISDRGILSRDPDDPDNTYLVLLNGLLAITKDGGKSWKNAITSEGVIAERLYGQIITGQNLTIGDADGILQFVGNKGIVSDSDGNMVMKLGLVEEANEVGEADRYGILLFRGSTNKVYLTQEDGLVIQKSTSNGWENVFSADIEGNFTAKDFSMVNMRIVNAEISGQGVYLDSADGVRIDGAGMRQITLNADVGIEMLNIVGDRVFFLDSNGNLNVRGINIISGALAGRDVETIGQSIDDLEVALIDVETYIDGAFKDSVISESEAKIIANHIETLNNEKADIDAHYTTIYSDTNLEGTPKTDLFASKTEYDSKHSALVTAIENAIADGSVTPAEKTNVDNKFNEYRTALSDISSKLEVAKKAITNKVVEPVDLKATTALDTANSASQDASDALTTANGLDSRVTTVEATATDAFANAENALTIAGNAETLANDALTQSSGFGDRITDVETEVDTLSGSITDKVSSVVIDTVNNRGRFLDLMNQSITGAHTGYLIIQTGITMTNQMTNLNITGYNNSTADNNIVDIDVSFYAKSDNSFANYSYVNKGSLDPIEVRLGIVSSKVVIILGANTKTWNSTNLLVPRMQVTNGIPLSSFKDGWTLTTATSLASISSLTKLSLGNFISGVNQLTNSSFNSYTTASLTGTRVLRDWEGGDSDFVILDPESNNPYSHILNIVKTGLASDVNIGILSKAIPIIEPSGKTYVLSFDIKIASLASLSSTDVVMKVQTFADENDSTTPIDTYQITKQNLIDKGITDGNWFRYVYKVNDLTSNKFLRVIPFITRNGDIKYRNLMFEEATQASTWNPSPSDNMGLIIRIKEAEEKITDDAILSTVRSSDLYKSDFDSYVSNDALSGYGFSTSDDLKSGLNGLDATLKKIISDEISAVKTEYSSVNQTARDITLSVSSGGGRNRLINSVGWAGVSAGWTQDIIAGGSVNTRQDETSSPSEMGELEMIGSGSSWILVNSSITQRVKTPVVKQVKDPITNTLVNESASYTVSLLLKKSSASSPFKIQVSHDDGSTYVDLATSDSDDYSWRMISGTFTALSEYTRVRLVSTGSTGQSELTNVMLNDGETPLQWSNHPSELYSTNARFDRFGMVISNNTTQNYTKITTEEFAGYAPVNGVMTKIFTLNGTTTEVNSLDAVEFLSVGTIKMQRINSGGRKGVAFLPIEDDDA